MIIKVTPKGKDDVYIEQREGEMGEAGSEQTAAAWTEALQLRGDD